MVTLTLRMVGASNADAKETIHFMEKRRTAPMMRGVIMDIPARSTNNGGEERHGGKNMNCKKCGIKISPTLARQQEGGENLCRECYTWKLAREQEGRLK